MRQPVAYLRKSEASPKELARHPSNGQPSWQVQEAQVKELAARQGDEGLLVLSDWGHSGPGDRTDRLAGYLRLKEMVENGEVSAIYGYSLSRLARNLSEYCALAELCQERGVPIRLCQEGEQDFSSPSGRLIMGILAAVAQMDAELAQERAEDRADGPTRVADELAEMVCRMGGLERSRIDRTADFADLGLDSLFLTRLASQIRKQMGVRVKLAEMLGGTPTIESLARRIEPEIATSAVAAPVAALLDPRPADGPWNGHPREAILPLTPASLNGHTAPSSDEVVALITEQLRVMDQQLDLLAARAGAAAEEPASERQRHQRRAVDDGDGLEPQSADRGGDLGRLLLDGLGPVQSAAVDEDDA